jgi:asparagine synthase (glutamine-hydrolysing)
MCGILCLCSNHNDPAFEQAVASLAHRGPDGHGTFIEGGVHMGHHRLAILDLSDQGAQPMVSEDGRYVLVYNGEIYNHLDLRAELAAANYAFHSTSDTETLLTGFAAYGAGVLEKLNGIFAFAIYDREEQTLFVARDQLGVKPLYYYWDGVQFAAASEIKAMMPLSNISSDIRSEAFADYLHFLWCPGE